MKIRIATSKPRNPFVAAARSRRAGVHGASGGARRQQMRLALRHEIDRVRHDSP
jgi:hypothetical protein